MSELEPSKSEIEPDIAEDALECRFGWGKSRAVYVDSGKGVLYFRKCHVPRRFLALAESWFCCPIENVRAVHEFRGESGHSSVTTVTESRKAIIPYQATHYDAFRATMEQLVPLEKPGFSTDHPMMPMASVLAALVGIFAGWMVTPRVAGEGKLAAFLLGGGFLGFIAVYALVRFCDQFEVNLAQPLGYATAGLSMGLTAFAMASPLFGMGLGPMLIIVVPFTIGGFAYGYHLQYRRRAEPTD